MESIIRAATLAPETRQLRRPSEGSGSPQTDTQMRQGQNAAIATPPQSMQAPVVEPAAQLEKAASRDVDPGADAQILIEQELAQARAQIEQELKTARTAAEHDGFAKGVEQGEAQARQAIGEQLARLGAIAVSIVQAKKEVIDGAEDVIVEVAYAAVCRIIGETAASHSAVAGMVNQVLDSFRERDRLIVRLHPQDYELLQSSNVDGYTPGFGAILRADDTIKIGGCVVESDTGYLDARLETQMACLREALLTARRRVNSVEESI